MSTSEQLAFAITLLAIGALCMIFPRKIQGFAVSTARFDAIRGFAQSTAYMIMVRIVGVGFLGMGLIVTWVTFWGPTD